MARPRRQRPAAVIDRLVTEPGSFDFVQAVRVLEAGAARVAGGGQPMAARFESPLELSTLGVQFVSDISLRYPVAALAQAEPIAEGGGIEITTPLIGLLGPLGVLPHAYTVHAIESRRRNNDALPAFTDIFHHRVVTLFYRAAVKYRIVLAHEAAERGGRDAFAAVLRALTGIALPALQSRTSVPDATVLHYAGLFGARTRPPHGLERISAQELDVAVEIVPLVGGWVELPPSEQTRLGSIDHGEGLNARLGSSALAGARTWIAQQHFRVRVGPVDEEMLQSFLPDMPRAERLRDLVRLYCGPEFTFELNMVVRADCIPPAALLSDDADPRASRLGQTSWVQSAPGGCDRDEAIFSYRDL